MSIILKTNNNKYQQFSMSTYGKKLVHLLSKK